MKPAEVANKANPDDIYNMSSALGVPTWIAPTQRSILYWPDARLSETCTDVTYFDDELVQLILDLAFTMVQNDGIGLAAPQVGVLLNVIVILQEWENVHRPLAMVNPKVVDTIDDATFSLNEGCLSVPGYYEDRKRPFGVVVEYFNVSGSKSTIELRGINAFVVQHEIDHLGGTVFVDNLSKLKQRRIVNKIRKTIK